MFLVSTYELESGKPLVEQLEYTDAIRRCFVTIGRDIFFGGLTSTVVSAFAVETMTLTPPDRDRVRVFRRYTAQHDPGVSLARAPDYLFPTKLPEVGAEGVMNIATPRRSGNTKTPTLGCCLLLAGIRILVKPLIDPSGCALI